LLSSRSCWYWGPTPMLDALKFAFEILVVAALAVPWLALLHEMFPSGSGFSLRAWLKLVPGPAGSAVATMVVLAFGYFLGSAIERISRNFFNDELWGSLPTEIQIRENVYSEAYCQNHLISELSLPYGNGTEASKRSFDFCPNLNVARSSGGQPIPSETPPAPYRVEAASGLMTAANSDSASTVAGNAPNPSPKGLARRPITEKMFRSRVEDMFRLQEGQLLLEGEDKVARLKEYYDQIAVLRGAVFNGLVLAALSAFGILGGLRSRLSSESVLQGLAFIPAFLVVVFALYSVPRHFSEQQPDSLRQESSRASEVPLVSQTSGKSSNIDVPDVSESAPHMYNHPPLAESVFLLLGLSGFVVIAKARQTASYVRTCLVAVVLTAISFGAWWWTEIMYDVEVIHSEPLLKLNGTPYVAN